MLLDLFNRLKNDVHYRIKFFSHLTLIFNICYFIFLLITSLIISSNWFFVMAVYYGLLSIVRAFVFKEVIKPKDQIAKIKTLRFCGYFFLLINFVVSVLMFILIFIGKHVVYHKIIVITLATHAFSTLTIAIIGSVKFIKQKDFVYSSIKLINLVSASVSMVTLTNTMLSTFGDDVELLRSIILPLLCIAVSFFIIATSIIMIKKANLALKSHNNKNE